MELSAYLLKRFAMLTNDSNESSASTTAYGTIATDGNSTYVMLDGASSYTAISEATDVRDGDRVLVSIENHVATIIGNLTCPASGRTAVEVSQELADYQSLIVVQFEAVEARIETLEANVITTSYLDATYATITELDSYKADITELVANYATVDDLTAATANISDLQSDVATIKMAYITSATVETLLANYATVADLDATNASITNLSSVYATIDDLNATNASITNLSSVYATIDDLNATNASITNLSSVYATITSLDAVTGNITDLTAEVANINSVLAGNVGAGTIQTVHLTSSNVVIDDAIITDAMIADLSASKLTAGTIYTSLIRIASDTGENFLIDGATLQIKDANGTYRIQMGEDGGGNYSYYLWDADGNLIFDALGAYALHDGIIKDVNVADDAAISGYKIDISTMSSALNEYGALIVDAAQITIDDTTLDYKLTTMVSSTAEAQAAANAAAAAAAALESEAVSNLTQYYALGASAEEPPSDPADGVTRAVALVDTATVDESRVDIAYANTDWTTEWLTASDGLYLWTAFYVEYADGHTGWTTPTCLSDGVARESVSTLVTELEVIQGQITAKVWQSDIDTAVDEVNGTITTLQDQYAQLVIDLDSISLSVGDLTTAVSDNYEELSSQISSLTVTASEITASVSELEQTIGDNYTEMNSAIATVSTTVSGISTTVTDLQSEVAENYTDLSSQITAVSETADGISATVSSLQTVITENYTELSDKLSELTLTAEDITASVSSIQSDVTDLSSTVGGTVTNAVTYFAISGSSTEPPCDPGETIIAATVDTAIVDSSMVGSIGWTTERLTAGEDEYLWTCNELTLVDGSTMWTTPVLVTDGYTRSSVATLTITAESIAAEVSDLAGSISTVEQTASSISSTVQSNYDDLSSQISQLADSIALCVTTDADTGYLRLGAGEDGTVKFTVDTDNLTIDEDGNVSMAGMVTATSGQIGPWTISQYTLFATATIDDITYQYYMQAATGDEDSRYSVFGVHDATNGTWPYRVFCDGSLACSGLTCSGDVVVDGFTTRQIVSIQTVSVTSSTSVASGSSWTCTGSFTAVSGAYYLLLPQRFNYGYCTAVSYSGTTITATVCNASGASHTCSGTVILIAYIF